MRRRAVRKRAGRGRVEDMGGGVTEVEGVVGEEGELSGGR